MKYLCHLPERRLFRPLPQTEQWAYVWELRASPQVRLCSQVANPWSSPVGLSIQPVFAQICAFDLVVTTATPDLPGCEIKLLEVPCYVGTNLAVYSFQNHDRHPMLMVLLPTTVHLEVANTNQPAQKGKASVKAPVKVKANVTKPLTNAADAAAIINEARTNEQRMDESAKAVEAAVAKLATTIDYHSLSTREKIAQLKTEIKQARGVGISTQTLYRDWIKAIWDR